KTPAGENQDRISREQQGFGGLARANFSEFNRSDERQAQFKNLAPEQQKTFQAGYDRWQQDEAKRAAEKAAQPVDPVQQRKDELQRTVSGAPLKLLDLSSAANRDPSKALDYAKVWNQADGARRELGQTASPSWFGAKRDV